MTSKQLLVDLMDQFGPSVALVEKFGRLLGECTTLECAALRFGKTPSPLLRLEKYKFAEQILGVVNDILIQRELLFKSETVVDAILLHGEKTQVFGAARYQGIAKLPNENSDMTWQAAMRAGECRRRIREAQRKP